MRMSNQAPNPRLQRTRSASPPSPLSRKPLGGMANVLHTSCSAGRFIVADARRAAVLIVVCQLASSCVSTRTNSEFDSESSLKARCKSFQLPTPVYTPQPEGPLPGAPESLSPVILHGGIDTDGQGWELTWKKSVALELAHVALQIASRYRYTPALCDGSPVRLGVTV